MDDKRPDGMRSNAENILRAALGESVEYDNPNSPVEYYLLKLKEAIESGGGGFTPTQSQLDAMNSGITAARVEELEGIEETGDDYITVNGKRVYISSTAPTGTIPDESIGIGF